MPAVRLNRVSFHYEDPIEVLTDLSLHLQAGWTGVVGENGCGKTTLLSILSGELAVDAGDVEREPAAATTLLCPQRVDDVDDAVRGFAESWERDACRLRARLALDLAPLDRWPTLSPGERKRWQIGTAMWQRPDVLLLDEPTNHLDASARALLLGTLRRFRGVGVLVSHDRALLDELCDHVVHLSRGEGRIYRGNYSAARPQWEAARERAQAAHASAQRQQRAVQGRLARARGEREAAAAKLSARTRLKGAKDSDARSVNAKARVANAEARLSRKVAVLRTLSERAQGEASRHRLERQRGRGLLVDYEPAPMPRLIDLQSVDVWAGDRLVLRQVCVAVERTSRIHVAGANGSGKTSLLGALMTAAGPRAEHLLYVPQEIDAPTQAGLYARLDSAEAAVRDRVLTIAAALGLDPSRALGSARPSPGELRKLMIAYGLGARVWAVLLDEPTNHLDLPSIERLEQALARYQGALLLVSHDPALAVAVTSERWLVGNGEVVVG